MNPTIFVVDDETDVRNAVAFALRQSGHTVRTFADGHELLSEVDSLLPELRAVFVLDVRMEPMSGPALHDALIARGLRERAPVLFLSGQGDIPLVVAAMSKGSLDFVEKPHIDRLVAKVTSALAQEADWFDTSRRAAFRLSLWVSLSPQQKRVACRVAQGKLNKFYKENCLLQQIFVKDNKTPIDKLLAASPAASNLRIVSFHRLQLGQ